MCFLSTLFQTQSVDTIQLSVPLLLKWDPKWDSSSLFHLIALPMSISPTAVLSPRPPNSGIFASPPLLPTPSIQAISVTAHPLSTPTTQYFLLDCRPSPLTGLLGPSLSRNAFLNSNSCTRSNRYCCHSLDKGATSPGFWFCCACQPCGFRYMIYTFGSSFSSYKLKMVDKTVSKETPPSLNCCVSPL